MSLNLLSANLGHISRNRMKKPRINTEWTTTERTWLEKLKAKHQAKTWPQLFGDALKFRERVEKIMGTGKLIVRRRDGTEAEIVL